MATLLLCALLLSSEDGPLTTSKTVVGATLNIEIQQPIDAKKAAEIADWIVATAETVNLTYGRFPNPTARVIVIPISSHEWSRESAVIFGRVTRRGGATVELFVNPDRPIEEFYADWTATHEFSHLMLPLLTSRNRWISEGFATYYQNVLMARAGRYSEEDAWRRVTAGLVRGRKSKPELSPNEAAARGIREARMKVYWSGTAIALLADVQLRSQAEGNQSLDSVLEQLQECCLPAAREWSGPKLFRKLDSFLEEPVFMPLYKEHADTDGFPETEATLSTLGIETTAGGIAFNNNAEHAEIRQAILRSKRR